MPTIRNSEPASALAGCGCAVSRARSDAPPTSDLDGLSPEARVALLAGLESARTRPPVYRGSFAQYANDDDE